MPLWAACVRATPSWARDNSRAVCNRRTRMAAGKPPTRRRHTQHEPATSTAHKGLSSAGLSWSACRSVTVDRQRHGRVRVSGGGGQRAAGQVGVSEAETCAWKLCSGPLRTRLDPLPGTQAGFFQQLYSPCPGPSCSTSALPGFRSSGLHVLEAYIAKGSQARGPAAGRDDGVASTSGRHERSNASRLWSGTIPADSVGFQLLRKSGWRLGAGLGADEQGRRDPILPSLPKGNRGIGFTPEEARQQQARRQEEENLRQGQRQQPQGVKRQAGEPPGQGRPATARSRMAALAAEELATETLPAKLARHRAVMR